MRVLAVGCLVHESNNEREKERERGGEGGGASSSLDGSSMGERALALARLALLARIR